jgi:hypothetical protein
MDVFHGEGEGERRSIDMPGLAQTCTHHGRDGPDHCQPESGCPKACHGSKENIMIVTATHRVTAAAKRRWWRAWARLATALLTTTAVSSPVLADVWFLGIGNDGCYTDVRGLRDAYGSYARRHSPNVSLEFLTFSNHGGSAILQDINWLAENARPGDLAFFYYSGHGGKRPDSSGEELAGWAVDSPDETIGRSGNTSSDDQLAEALRKIDSKVPTIALFDSCYSGGMVGGTADLNTLPNVYAMMSSREDEDSYGGFPYSRFTAELIRGIGYSLPADANGNGHCHV